MEAPVDALILTTGSHLNEHGSMWHLGKVSVLLSCFSESALAALLAAFFAVFLSASLLAFSIVSVRSCCTMLEACAEFASSFWQSANFVRNSSRNFLSTATMPPDWNSYAFASGAE